MTLATAHLFPRRRPPRLVLGGRGIPAYGPAEPVGAGPPARGRTGRSAVRARRPRPRADRGRPASTTPRRAHAGRGPAGDRVRARGARAHRRHRRLRDVLAAPTTTSPATWCRTSGSATRASASASIGQNSAEVADAVRNGALEAGLIVLPVEDAGLDVRVAVREELLYISANPDRVKEPVTIEKLAQAPLILADARWAAMDPTRRQLRERAQAAGVTIVPQIEVEYLTAALDLAVRGLGDTVGDAVDPDRPRLHPPARQRLRSIRRSTRRSRSSPAATPISRPPRASS